jgi:F420-non-reducing hydrogenase small subunit
MSSSGRARLAVYWTTGCGGCEAAFLDLGDRLLEVEREFELAYFPMLVDRKRDYLESLPDGAIDLTLLTGAIRTTEDVDLTRLLRRVSKRLVAFGACAQLGSVLALADLAHVTTLLRTVYGSHPAFDPRSDVPHSPADSTLPRLPGLTPRVEPVEALVPVDHSVPGCPPEVDRLWEFLQLFAAALTGRGELPEPGAVLGCSEATVCEECSRRRPETRVPRFYRAHQVDPDPDGCLLDEGLVCSGPATRGGCGAPCPAAGAACRGCYGAPSEVEDQGARMLAALAVMAEIEAANSDEIQLRTEAERVLATVSDPVGTLYRYSFARSLLAGLRQVKDAPP